MNALGLDVGFSITKATNSFCLLNVDEAREEIGLVERAERFLRRDAPELFRRLSWSYPEARWVSVDAPLTSVGLTLRPKSGRSVDKRFSRGIFHGSRRGPQPGSVSVPVTGVALVRGRHGHRRESSGGGARRLCGVRRNCMKRCTR